MWPGEVVDVSQVLVVDVFLGVVFPTLLPYHTNHHLEVGEW